MKLKNKRAKKLRSHQKKCIKWPGLDLLERGLQGKRLEDKDSHQQEKRNKK